MTYYYYPGMPVYYGDYNQAQRHMNIPQQTWSQMAQQKLKAAPSNKGNVCAYAPDQPVSYHKLHVTHWPSDDYKKPHPKGFTHTMHLANMSHHHK